MISAILLIKLLAISSAFQSQLDMIDNNEWVVAADADSNELHTLIFAVQRRNLDLLEKHLFDVSTPSSNNYGKHWSLSEIGKLTSSPEKCEFIKTWLLTSGVKISWTSKNCDYIKATSTIAKWSTIFQANFLEFHHKSGVKMTRTKRALVPEILEPYLFAIFNLVDSESPPHKKDHILSIDKKSTNERKLEQSDVTVYFLDELYNIGYNNGTVETSQSVFQTGTQKWSPNDLLTFQTMYDLTVQNPVQHSGQNTTFCTFDTCGEANLDLQYIMGVSQKTTTYYWYSNGFLEWILDVSDSDNPPRVNSISYGSDELKYTKSKMTSFNTEAMQLGLMGVTIFVSSGDDGVSNYNCACNVNSGYVPSFPATSPYVTAVGATQGPEDGNAEIVCQSTKGGVITSGGGFSSFFDQPTYQTEEVTQYFSSISPAPKSGYNAAGRGYPDVSLIGVNYPVVIQGITVSTYGTSASCPVLAAMVALINSERYLKNMSSLGFLNPSLYAAASNASTSDMYHDITQGNNSCCASSSPPYTCCAAGFIAATGWDPTTGLGSVDFTLFAKYIGGVDTKPYVDTGDDGSSDDTIDKATSKAKNFYGDLPLYLQVALIFVVTCGGLTFLTFCFRCCKRMCKPSDHLRESLIGMSPNGSSRN